MALAAVNITVGQSLGDGKYSSAIKSASVPVLTTLATVATDIATVNTDMTTVTANVATLVADGATPTQGHVNTLNTNFTTLSTDVTALGTAITAASAAATTLTNALNGDVMVVWDGSTITHRNQLRHALLVALRAVEGGYGGLAE